MIAPGEEQNMEIVKVSALYPFACLILLLQAMMFYTPYVISRELNRLCGLQLEELSLSALEARRTRDTDEREAAVKDIASHVHTFCMRQLRRRHVSYAFRWLHGVKLSLVQLLGKVLYGANAIGQFYMLDKLLGIDFHSLGWIIIGRNTASAMTMSSLGEFLEDILRTIGIDEHALPDAVHELLNKTSTDPSALGGLPVAVNLLQSQNHDVPNNNSTIFPTEFMCDFLAVQLGTIHRYTVQCTLPLNQLNEIIFQCVWFVLFCVAVVTIISLFMSVFHLIIYPCQRMTIRDRLQDLGLLNDEDFVESARLIELFENDFLRMDGMLLLSYVEAGAGDVISDTTLKDVWEMYTAGSTSDFEALSKPMKRHEKVVEDVFRVPTYDTRGTPEHEPLGTDYIPVTPQYSHDIETANPIDETETEFSQTPHAPPDYLATMQSDMGKVDDDFMV
jgi:hypothetical protein